MAGCEACGLEINALKTKAMCMNTTLDASLTIATRRRTVEKEIKAIGLTWGEAEMVALDLRQRVEASCSARN